jgi:predicted lipoprotein
MITTKYTALSATALSCALLLSACGGGGSSSSSDSNSDTGLSEEERQSLVQAITRQQILPAVADLHEQAAVLNSQAQNWCQQPDAEGLPGLQQQWLETADAWYQVQLFNFGPADADPVFPLYTYIDSLRLRGTDYRETVRTTQQNWLAEDTLDATFFAEQRFQYVGLLALEEALFYGDDLAESYATAPQRCAILTGLSDLLQQHVQQLDQGWNSDYNNSGSGFAQRLIDNQLPNAREALAQILISGQEYLDYLKKRNVATQAGTTAEASWQLVDTAFEASKRLLTEPYAGASILERMQQQGYELNVNAVNANIAMAEQALAERNAVDFNAAIGMLDGNFKREIPVALGIDLGINFTDGD